MEQGYYFGSEVDIVGETIIDGVLCTTIAPNDYTTHWPAPGLSQLTVPATAVTEERLCDICLEPVGNNPTHFDKPGRSCTYCSECTGFYVERWNALEKKKSSKKKTVLLH